MKAEEYYNLGNNYYNDGNWEEAIKYYSEAIKLEPDNEDYYTDRANCYEELGNWKEAIEDFSKAIKLEPDNEDYYAHRADCYKELKQYDLAIKDYSQAIKLNPVNEDSYAHRADCYEELEQYYLAIEDYTKAIEINSDWWGYYTARGICYRELEQYDLAIKDYTKAIELCDDDHGKNLCNKIIQNVINFKEIYESKMQMKTNIEEIIEKLGLDLTVDEYFDCTFDIAKYTEILQAEPDNIEAYFCRATAYLKLKDIHNAFVDFVSCCILDNSKLEKVKPILSELPLDTDSLLKSFEGTIEEARDMPMAKTNLVKQVRDKLLISDFNNEDFIISKILNTQATKGRKLDL